MTTENNQHSITTRHYSHLFTDGPVTDVFEITEGSRVWTIVSPDEFFNTVKFKHSKVKIFVKVK